MSQDITESKQETPQEKPNAFTIFFKLIGKIITFFLYKIPIALPIWSLKTFFKLTPMGKLNTVAIIVFLCITIFGDVFKGDLVNLAWAINCFIVWIGIICATAQSDCKTELNNSGTSRLTQNEITSFEKGFLAWRKFTNAFFIISIIISIISII